MIDNNNEKTNEKEETDFVFGIAGAEFTKSSSENSKSTFRTSF